MTECFVALGSNLDSPRDQIINAIRAFHSMDNCQLLSYSSLYVTKPVGPQSQANFINAVIKIATRLSPLALLRLCRNLEVHHQRVHYYDWGPRTLDVDILLYGAEQLSLPELIIPHPRMTERDFVLMPLLEIEPEASVYGHGSLQDRLSSLPKSIIEKLPLELKEIYRDNRTEVN